MDGYEGIINICTFPDFIKGPMGALEQTLAAPLPLDPARL